MKPKILNSEKDYKAALTRIENLMDGDGADEGELERLAVLVEKYEEKHFPIEASNQGA